MTSDNNKLLQRILAPVLKAEQFRKKGPTWRRLEHETIQVINIQGSQWGPSFYINLGVYFCAIGDRKDPLECDCHIRTRLRDLVSNRSRVIELLEFEKPIAENERASEMLAAIEESALPWLRSVATMTGAREYCIKQSSRSPWITEEARRFLGLAPDV